MHTAAQSAKKKNAAQFGYTNLITQAAARAAVWNMLIQAPTAVLKYAVMPELPVGNVRLFPADSQAQKLAMYANATTARAVI